MVSSSHSLTLQCRRSNLISPITRDPFNPCSLLFSFHAGALPHDGCTVLIVSLSAHCCLTQQKTIHEFPQDIFTKEQRKKGAVCLHAIYMFYALAIVCDDYFVPSLEKISENLQLSEDVAGATFMAAGSSAPELFTSLIGVFITKGDVGVGTIVGSAVFNILVIIGLSGIFAGQTVVLTWWPLFRDSSYYILAVLTLIMVRCECYLSCLIYNNLFTGQAHHQEASPVIMVDELLILNPHKLSFSDAGLLSMAGRMLISEVFDTHGTHIITQSSLSSITKKRPTEEEKDDDGIFNPVRIPGSCCARVKWLIKWPLGLLLYCTVPNCIQPRWHRWFMVTFVASTLWIAIFSYLMVWMVTIISFTLAIPDYIMGITFLAAGTSVPDCMASLIVARQGMGDMAVSNSIGSNIFDILLGLGFPWALRTLVVDYGSSVNLFGSCSPLSLCFQVTSVHLNHWKLDRRLGLGLLFLYAIFLLFSILFGQM
uniref:Sodium/calcium exchanger membrane region domain-containing protein n=1 Tax=Sander lucioperca TaxID=283035 RepID=A0A8C9Y7Q4_SANLU